MWRAIVLIGFALLTGGCTRLFFHPDHVEVMHPARLGLAYEDVYVTTPDDVTLHGWWLPANGAATGTVVFFHGNAENITTHVSSVWWLPKAGFNVLLVDYRGYGRSAGRASLAGLLTDIEATLTHVWQTPAFDSRHVIVFGQSLGGALAVRAVADSPHKSRIRALIVDSAFSGYRTITREKMAGFWLTWPFQWLPWVTIPSSPDAVKSIARVAPVPVLIVHGDADHIVPPSHARALFDAAVEPKELWIIPQRGHIQAFSDAAQRERLVAYMRRAIDGANTRPSTPAT